jgi:zinc and cadmium transporter
MSAIAAVGGLTTVLRPATLERILLPLVALAAGCLLGSAFFHMIPEGSAGLTPLSAAAWVVSGFSSFLALEQFLNWHHSHRDVPQARRPVTYLILVGDAAHNFLGGMGVASTFLISPRAGVIAWIAAAAHEVPQELGDFGILIKSGWSRPSALVFNLLSGTTFLVGALIALAMSGAVDVLLMLPFAAGNFAYIAASDLIPQLRATGLRRQLGYFGAFLAGLAFLLLVAI